jgi:hypothetical protein
MKLLDKLQRRFGRFAVPHVTVGLIACQAAAFFLCLGRPAFSEMIALVPRRVLDGEAWRLFTFVCQPPGLNPLWAFFFWYLFYLMGTVLENTWGAFRYNAYLLIGWLATVAMSFLQPDSAASILFLQGSVFLAFAYLYPDFQLLLFFILPVKVKWLALLQWIGYFFVMLFGSAIVQILATAAICNFLLFFGHDIFLRIRAGRWRMAQQVRQIRAARTPRHTCVTCGVNNLTDPTMGFRYCSKCIGTKCYCETHLRMHEHVTAESEPESDERESRSPVKDKRDQGSGIRD